MKCFGHEKNTQSWYFQKFSVRIMYLLWKNKLTIYQGELKAAKSKYKNKVRFVAKVKILSI